MPLHNCFARAYLRPLILDLCSYPLIQQSFVSFIFSFQLIYFCLLLRYNIIFFTLTYVPPADYCDGFLLNTDGILPLPV